MIGFFTMSKWVCDLLVTHCIMNHPRYEETGKLNPAKVMRRILQLLAAGIFLPNSVGLSDPTENGKSNSLLPSSLLFRICYSFGLGTHRYGSSVSNRSDTAPNLVSRWTYGCFRTRTTR